MDSRDILIGHINDGIDTKQTGDNSNKSILVRGCDSEMGRRAIRLFPPVLGNPEMVSITNDDDFINELQKKSGRLFSLHLEHVDMMREDYPFQVVVHKQKVGGLQSIENWFENIKLKILILLKLTMNVK
jgi:hypothetical protein